MNREVACMKKWLSKEIPTPADQQANEAPDTGTKSTEEQAFKQHILELLSTLENKLHRQGEMLNQFLSPGLIEKPFEKLIKEPFRRLEELLEFDRKLDKQKRDALVRELSQLGGGDAKSALRHILPYCMTNELAMQFSWLGRKGNHSLSTLNIAKAITGAATKRPADTVADIEASIKTWLKNAAARHARTSSGPEAMDEAEDGE